MARKKVEIRPDVTVKEATSDEVGEQILTLQSNIKEVETPPTEEIPAIIGTQPTAEELAKDEQKGKEEQEVKEPVEEDKGGEEQTEEKEVKEKETVEEVKKTEEKLKWGKFKSDKAAHKAYKESERKISEQGAQLSQAKQALSQFYELDEQGTIIGTKIQQQSQSQQQPYQQPVGDPLAGVRQYFPEKTDEQISSLLTVQAQMTQAGLTGLKKEIMKELEPFRALQHERAADKQKEAVRQKYQKDIPNFDNYEKVVDSKMKNLPPELRAKESAREMMFLATLGEATPELIEQAKQTATEKAQAEIKEIESKAEDAHVEGAGKPSVPTPPIDTGSMSSDEYLKYIKKLPGYGQE